MNRIEVEVYTGATITNSAVAACDTQPVTKPGPLVINGTSVTAGSLEARFTASTLVGVNTNQDCSGITFTIWGRQAGPNCTDGSIISETIVGPNNTVGKTTKYFSTVIGVTVNGVPPAGLAVQVGAFSADAGYTNAIPVNWRSPIFNLSYTVLISGTATAEIDVTQNDVESGEPPVWISLDTAITTNKTEQSFLPVVAARLKVSSWTSGTVKFIVLENGYGI